MSKTLIDVDDALLKAAQEILGAATKKETVNAALREIVRRHAASEFLDLARAGIFSEPGQGD